MKKPLLVSLILASIATQSIAANHMGAGRATCGRYSSLQEVSEKWVINSWVLGYLSATNNTLVALGEPDLFINIDSSAIFASIALDCSKNPLNNINDVANNIVSQLMSKRKK